MSFDPMGKMIAGMLGVSPEQVQKAIENTMALLQNVDMRIGNIEQKLDDLHAEMVRVKMLEDLQADLPRHFFGEDTSDILEGQSNG